MGIKKKSIANLIKYHVLNDNDSFRDESYSIIHEIQNEGDLDLANYLLSLLSDRNTILPQSYDIDPNYFRKLPKTNDSLFLPRSIESDIINISKMLSRNTGVNKIIFEGKPGTGKTEAVRQIARIVGRDLYVVDFNRLIDSKLGQTAKNISDMFNELNLSINANQIIILFDEIDAIVLDRINSRDIREMGRATTEFLKGLDGLREDIVIIATTNLYNSFDPALKRRFDITINFDRYTKEDRVEVANNILIKTLEKFSIKSNNIRLAKKIFEKYLNDANPGDIKNIIRAAVVFSDPESSSDYLIK